MDKDRLIVVLRGRFIFRDRQIRRVASPRTALCLNDGHAYQIRHAHDGGDVCLSIQGTLVQALREQRPTAVDLSPRGYVLLQGLARGLLERRAATRLELEETLCDAFEPERHTASVMRRRDATLVEAIRYRLERDCEEPISLHELANAEHVSMFHMCRVFRQVVGTSIHRYQAEVRLQHALALLLETDRSMTQIALDLGFANHGHFCNSFRRRFRTTPSSVRRLGRNAVQL